MDCSDGARMLIERMQTNPEEFESSRGKFGRVLENTYSERDKKAITKAHDLHIKEPRLMVYVLEALLAQPEEDEIGLTKFKTQNKYAMGQIKPYDPAKFDPYTDSHVLTDQTRITREMYEDHIQTHKSPIKKHVQAVAAEKESIAAQIYNKAFGRDRIERDN